MGSASTGERQLPQFGALLRQHRLAAGLTQQALADRARLSIRGIADLERGIRRFPYSDTVERLGGALDLSAADREALMLSGRRSTVASSRLVPSPNGPGWPSWSTTLDALPAQPTRLIGRDHEVVELRRHLKWSAPRLLTLIGPGGTGKTRLALAVAEGLQEEFEDGIFFVDLAPLGDSELVVPAIARALGIREVAGGAVLEHLRQVLDGRHILVVLDNCEHVLGAASDLARLLASCSELHILATSREPLRLDWEQSVPVLPLTLPDPAGLHTPAALASVPSIALFVERAQAVEPSFQLDDNNCAATADLCARLDGLPLAIELAAARINVLSVPELREHLSKRLDVLRRVGPDRPPRHMSLQATLDWSVRLLSTSEQCLLWRLAVFAGGWTLEAAERVCAGKPIDPKDVLELLSALIERSLVVAEQQEGRTRYRLLETVKVYATEQLERSTEETSLRRRHRDWYLALAEATPPELFEPEAVEKEAYNLRQALRWSIDVNDADASARLCEGMWSFWSLGRYGAEGYAWMRELLLMPALRAPTARRARSLAWFSHLTFLRGNLPDAERLAQESLALARAHEDLRSEALASAFGGHIAREAGDLDTAFSRYAALLAASQRLGNWMLETHALYFLAWVAREQGDCERALNLGALALASAGQRSNRYMMARSLTGLGEVALTKGDRRAACGYLEQAVALTRTRSDNSGLARALLALGLAESDAERACEHLIEVLELARQMGDLIVGARALDALAGRLAPDTPVEAIRLVAKAAGLRRSLVVQPFPKDRERRDELVQLMRRNLGQLRFELAWNEGLKLSVDEALLIARRIQLVAKSQPSSTTVDP